MSAYDRQVMEAARQALYQMLNYHGPTVGHVTSAQYLAQEAIDALNEALSRGASGEPVAYLVDWADVGEGTARSFFYSDNAKEQMDGAVSYGKTINRAAKVTPLYD